MDQSVLKHLLKQLGAPYREKGGEIDPLAKVRECHKKLPAFPRLLCTHFDVFKTEKETLQRIEKILCSGVKELKLLRIKLV